MINLQELSIRNARDIREMQGATFFVVRMPAGTKWCEMAMCYTQAYYDQGARADKGHGLEAPQPHCLHGLLIGMDV